MSDNCETVLRRHMDALKSGDLDAILADYAEDAVILRGDIAIKGKAAIAEAFGRMSRDLVDVSVQDSIATEGEYQLVVWHLPSGLCGSDLFHVRDGRIIFQAVAFHGDH